MTVIEEGLLHKIYRYGVRRLTYGAVGIGGDGE